MNINANIFNKIMATKSKNISGRSFTKNKSVSFKEYNTLIKAKTKNT
jgi:hypothetical protein